MDCLVTAMNETGSDLDQMEKLSQNLQVRFQTNFSAKTKPQAPNQDMDGLWKALVAAKVGKHKLAPDPKLWFGMLTNKAKWWLTSNSIIANNVAKSPGSIIAQVFHSQKKLKTGLKTWI